MKYVNQKLNYNMVLFIVKRTLIPMVRVQHVDTAQGPILRKYNLAGITDFHGGDEPYHSCSCDGRGG